MRETPSLRELLAIEDEPALLEYACAVTQIPLWSLIRNLFFRFAMSDQLFSRSLVEQKRGENFRRNVLGAVHAVFRATVHNALRARSMRGQIVITTGSAGLLWQNGRWFNRLSDYFVSVGPERTVTVEDLFAWQWRSPRYSERRLFHTPLFLHGYIAGKLRVADRHRRKAAELVALVRERARQAFDWDLGDKRAEFLTRLLARDTAAIPVLSREYRRLLTRLQARLVLKEMACYGRSAVFNVTARELGITLAEHQHGLVSLGHDAYNVAPALAASAAYRRTLPEYLLSYGPWWGAQMSVPVTAVPIGNPHRTERVRKFERSAGRTDDILILSDGYETARYVELARELARLLGGERRIVFRPHPIERQRFKTAPPADLGEVHIDGNLDIYDSFAAAGVVVSEASTGLFEAVGIVEKIFALQTPRAHFSLPRHPFAACTDAADLAQKVRGGALGHITVAEAADIWMPDWQRNYREFLRTHLGD
jgi:hypothetical protein